MHESRLPLSDSHHVPHFAQPNVSGDIYIYILSIKSSEPITIPPKEYSTILYSTCL